MTAQAPASASAVESGHSLLSDQLGALILEAEPEIDPDRPADHLAIVHRAAEAHGVTRDLLQRSVTAARGSGHSWAAIGEVLGLTRQAAQQRFGPITEDALDPDVRWLGPVTAFDEMAELEIAGRLGWRTVDAGILKHKMIRTRTQWEHRRVVWHRPAASYEKEGWQVAVRAFPWLYLVRDTGRPAES